MEFLFKNLSGIEVYCKDVLEVGAQNVNGTPREVIRPLGPRTYWGVDFIAGDGVDLVLDVKHLSKHFGTSSFDIVISTEMLEHAEDWVAAITQMKEVLRPGGILVVTARGPGFPYHGFPHDHWRFTTEDFRKIFSDMDVEICQDDTAPGVLFKGRKTTETGTVDLTKIKIQPMTIPVEVVLQTGSVDLLTANWNTLPWLKLLRSQVKRFQPKIKTNLMVWDNASTDGSAEWLANEKIHHVACQSEKSHGDSLAGMIEKTGSTYIAFMDVDAVPVRSGWLDEAIALLEEPGVGIVGLSSRIDGEYHRPFVHPSFCVFRRDLYQKLNLTPYIVHDYEKKIAFDVCETMCSRIEDAGYSVKFLGNVHLDLAHRKEWVNGVVHCGSSTPVMSEKRTDLPFVEMVNAVVRWHKLLLVELGIWGEFENYIQESVRKNPRCALYVERRSISPEKIRLSIVIPTIGRKTLKDTLESIDSAGVTQLDEVIVIGDGSQPEAEEICNSFRRRMKVIYQSSRKTSQYGAHQRNIGMGIATGTHILFMDDDDRYRSGAFRVVRRALSEAPDRPHLFRIESTGDQRPFKVLWTEKEFKLGNVGTQMIALPIVDGLLGSWPNGHCADYGFLRDTLPRFGLDRIIWREEIIAELGNI